MPLIRSNIDLLPRIICPGNLKGAVKADLKGMAEPTLPVLISLIVFSTNCPVFSIPLPAASLTTSNPCPSFSLTGPAIFLVIGNTPRKPGSVSLIPFPMAPLKRST